MSKLYQYGIGGLVAFLIVGGVFYTGYKSGGNAEENKLLKEENKLLEAQTAFLLQTNERIIKVFNGYDEAYRKIQAYPLDSNPVPPSIAASVDIMRGKADNPSW